jgi:hypothetical protein
MNNQKTSQINNGQRTCIEISLKKIQMANKHEKITNISNPQQNSNQIDNEIQPSSH